MQVAIVDQEEQPGQKSSIFNDSNILVRSDALTERVLSILSNLNQYGRTNLISVIGLPNAHISTEDNELRGVVFVMNGNMSTAAIMASHHDIGAGVSSYSVSSFDGQVNVEAFTTKLTASLNDTSLLKHENVDGVALGRVNCSVGIYRARSHNVEEIEDSWHIIVRSYYTKGSEALRNKILSDNPTVQTLYNSQEYKDLIHNANRIRDAIAVKFAQSVGAKLGEPTRVERLFGADTTLAKSSCINHYNVIQKLPVFQTKTASYDRAYAFYSGCYGFAEGNSKCFLFGLGPTKGYEVFGFGAKDIRIGSDAYAYAVPMGVTKTTSNVPHEQEDQFAKFVNWGGRFKKHTRVQFSTYDYNTLSDKRGLKYILRSSGFGQVKPPSMRFLPRSVYLSSPSELRAPVSTLVEFDATKDAIPIPKNHRFIDRHLISGWRELQKINPDTKLFGDVVVKEDDLYMVINAKRLREIISVEKAKEMKTLQQEYDEDEEEEEEEQQQQETRIALVPITSASGKMVKS